MNHIPNEVILLRRIPGHPLYQGSPKKAAIITHYNFRLRHEIKETGISVDPEEDGIVERLLAGQPEGTKVASASVKDIEELGLKIVQTPNDQFPNHCEIQSDSASLDDKETREALAKVFTFL